MTDTPTLDDIAFQLAETNVLSQSSEELRKELKSEFFKLVNDEVEDDLATKTIVIPDGLDAEEYVDQYHGDWKIYHQEDQEVVLIEKPESKPFEIVVQTFDEDGDPIVVQDKKGKEALGFVVSRSIRVATPIVDYKRLESEDHDLYLRLTDEPVVPPYIDELLNWFCDTQRNNRTIEELRADWLEDNPQPRPIKEDAKLIDLAKLKKSYLIQPPSTAVLNVRLAKEDEVG